MNNPNVIGGKVPRKQNRTTHLPRTVLLKRLWEYLGRNRLLLVLAAVLSLSSSLLSLYGPKLSGQAINAIDFGKGRVDLDTVIRCCSLMVLFYCTAAALSYLLQFVMIRLSRRVAKQMRHDIFENMTRLPVGFFDNYQTGDLISTITYDVDTVTVTQELRICRKSEDKDWFTVSTS